MKLRMNNIAICVIFVIISIIVAVIDAYIPKDTILFLFYMPLFICSMVVIFRNNFNNTDNDKD